MESLTEKNQRESVEKNGKYFLKVAFGLFDKNADGSVELARGSAAGSPALQRRFVEQLLLLKLKLLGGHFTQLHGHVLRLAQLGTKLLDLDEVVTHHLRHV